MLTKQELQEKAPSIFTQQPISYVSDRYTFVPTSKIVEDMLTFGWYPVHAQEQKVYQKTQHRQGFQKHIIQFQNNEVEAIPGEIVPRLLLTNSHDGLNSFKFQAGLFRFVCSIGLVVADTTYNSFKIRHKDYTLSEIEKNIYEYVQDVPDTINQVEKYKSITLNKDEQDEFASQAIDIRWNDNPPVNVDQILNRRRIQDQDNDLWTIYNVIQENIINPDFHAPAGERRRVKKITSINKNLEVNKALWTLMASWSMKQ